MTKLSGVSSARPPVGGRSLLFCFTLALAACQQPPPPATASPEPQVRGRVLAAASCSRCHAIGPYGLSPNPDAPPFASIVNQEGLTSETLTTFLRDAHNYPREMEFQIGAREVDELVAYMLTLKDPNYKPPQ